LDEIRQLDEQPLRLGLVLRWQDLVPSIDDFDVR
jgi:hypothetical protein